MKLRLKTLMMSLALGSIVSACALTSAPVNGWVYNSAKGPVSAAPGNIENHTKEGRSHCHAVSFYVSIAWGDCTIGKAQEEGGLTEVSVVDSEHLEVLGVYGRYTTVVHGN